MLYRTAWRKLKVEKACKKLMSRLTDEEIAIRSDQPKDLFTKRNCTLVRKLCDGSKNYDTFFEDCDVLSLSAVETIKL